ncbi:MAG: hypothetical protein AAGN46_17645 [Acidobacteriota bacterium]
MPEAVAAVRPRVKICGIVDVDDAVAAARLGADFLGLNFHPPSPRSLDVEMAAQLVRETRARLTGSASPRWVGVFVAQGPSEIEDIADRVGLDLMQFHGNYGPDDVAAVASRAVVALRVRERLDEIDLTPWLELDPWAFLIDARHPTLYGGSGHRWDVASLRASPLAERRTFIAGGLRPSNVAAAVAAARPWGIDLASGVEKPPTSSAAPGGRPRKDPELLARLFEEIHHGSTPSAA